MKKYLWAQKLFLFLGAAALVASCQPKKPDKAPKNPCYEEETYSDFFEEDAFDSTITTEEEISDEADDMVSEEESPSMESEELSEQHSQAEEPSVSFEDLEEASSEQAEAGSPAVQDQPQMTENSAEGIGTSPSPKATAVETEQAVEETTASPEEKISQKEDDPSPWSLKKKSAENKYKVKKADMEIGKVKYYPEKEKIKVKDAGDNEICSMNAQRLYACPAICLFTELEEKDRLLLFALLVIVEQDAL